MKTKTILLSFDVEEFDTPLRHKIRLPKDKQLQYGYEGLEKLMSLLDTLSNVPCTFYTTANFALHYSEMIKNISQNHEIASHTFYHSTFKAADIKTSKICLEDIIGKQVFGFRMPNMKSFDHALISEAGYLYDSSINPTFLPGKYNNLSTPTHAYKVLDFWELPTSVVPIIRIPLFWLAFKNFPFQFYVQLCKMTLKSTDLLHLYFHPWEFADLSSFNIPSFIINPNGVLLLDRLKKFIEIFRVMPNTEFQTTIDYLKGNYMKE